MKNKFYVALGAVVLIAQVGYVTVVNNPDLSPSISYDDITSDNIESLMQQLQESEERLATAEKDHAQAAKELQLIEKFQEDMQENPEYSKLSPDLTNNLANIEADYKEIEQDEQKVDEYSSQLYAYLQELEDQIDNFGHALEKILSDEELDKLAQEFPLVIGSSNEQEKNKLEDELAQKYPLLFGSFEENSESYPDLMHNFSAPDTGEIKTIPGVGGL